MSQLINLNGINFNTIIQNKIKKVFLGGTK